MWPTFPLSLSLYSWLFLTGAQGATTADAGSLLADFSTLKMEAIRSSETLVNAGSTQHNIPEDDILQLLPFLFRFYIIRYHVLVSNHA
jgi:hypothetical protein